MQNLFTSFQGDFHSHLMITVTWTGSEIKISLEGTPRTKNLKGKEALLLLGRLGRCLRRTTNIGCILELVGWGVPSSSPQDANQSSTSPGQEVLSLSHHFENEDANFLVALQYYISFVNKHQYFSFPAAVPLSLTCSLSSTYASNTIYHTVCFNSIQSLRLQQDPEKTLIKMH